MTDPNWRHPYRATNSQNQDISLIPGVTQKVRSGLQQEGIRTLSDLAQVNPQHLCHIKGIGSKSSRTMVYRARAFLANKAVSIHEFSLSNWPVELYFDVESVQIGGYGQEATRYYLLGWCVRQDQSKTFDFHYELAEHPNHEGEIWQRFLERIDLLPGPVFHYSPYEKQTVKTLCNRYGADPRAQRLLERLTDLYPLIKNNIALPLKSYSIKAVAPWLGYQWTGATQTAEDSMFDYSDWLRTADRTYLDNILTYNEHDCRAMVVIKDWLTQFNQLQTSFDW